MVRIVQDLDEVLAEHRRIAAFANRNLAPQQQAITWGSTWARFDSVSEGVVIFGRVLTQDEVHHGCIRAGASELEARRQVREVQRRQANDHVVFSRFFGTLLPEGERGAAHRIGLWPIERRTFDALALVGWDHSRLDTGDLVYEAFDLSVAFIAWRAHMREAQQREAQRKSRFTVIDGGKD